MAITQDDTFPSTSHGAKKKDDKQQQHRRTLPLHEIAGNEEKQEKTKNARMEEEEEQGNKNAPITFKLISFINNFMGSRDTGLAIIRDDKLHAYDIKKGPLGGEQHLFNATYGNELTDPRVFGPLYFPDSQIITVPLSGKGVLEIKRLFSQICGMIEDEQAYSFTGNGHSTSLEVELRVQLQQLSLKGDMNLRGMYKTPTLSPDLSALKQVYLGSKEEEEGIRGLTQLTYAQSKISQIDQAQKQRLIQQLYKIVSQTRYQRQQEEKPHKVLEDSDGELKNYSSRDAEDFGKYFNLYYPSMSMAGKSDMAKNLVDLEKEDSDGESDFHTNFATKRKADSKQTREEEDASELIVMYWDHRHVLVLLSSQAGDAPRIEEKIQLQWHLGQAESSLLIASPKHSFETRHDDTEGHQHNFDWKQKEKAFEEEEDFNSIDKQGPRVPDPKRKNSDDFAIGQKGQKKDVDRPVWQAVPRPQAGPGALKICVAELGVGRTAEPSVWESHDSGSDLFSSTYGEEGEEEEGDSSLSAGEDEDRESEVSVSSPSSIQQDEEEELPDSFLAPSILHDAGAVRDGEPRSRDISCDQRNEHQGKPFKEGRDPEFRASDQAMEREQTMAKKMESDVEDSSLPSGTPVSVEADEGETYSIIDVEADGTSLHPPVSEMPCSSPTAHGPAVEEARARTPPLRTPVQASSYSPPGSASTLPATSGGLYTDDFPCEDMDGRVYRNNSSQAIFRDEYERSSQLGACARHAPIVAQEQGHHFHYTTSPMDDRWPRVTEETHYHFFSQDTQRPRPPAQSPPRLYLQSTQPHAQETTPAEPVTQSVSYSARNRTPLSRPVAQSHSFYYQSTASSNQPTQSASFSLHSPTPSARPGAQSESFCPRSPAPVRLPPVTVHAAGSLPPWATRTARIDLSQAARRDFAQLRSRRATYEEDWPTSNSGIDPANMALAGFYRNGGERRVRCFFCGLELNPSSHHNVWDEHVRHRPTCAYLQAIMGPEFVQQTLMRLSKP